MFPYCITPLDLDGQQGRPRSSASLKHALPTANPRCALVRQDQERHDIQPYRASTHRRLATHRRHSLFSDVVRLDPLSPANQALMLCRGISMNHCLPADWKRPRGRPRNTWVGQVRKDGGIPISTAWTRAMDRRLWGRGRDGLEGSVG